jgi:hypothetical protein
MNKTLLILTAFILGLNAFSQIPNYVPSNGLVGWWPFNGNANDESGNGNNGTVNGAILSTDRFGNANQAYGFDGVDDLISSMTNNIPTTGLITISTWIRPNQNNGIAEFICLGSASSTTWGTLAGTNWNGSPYMNMNYGRGCSGTGAANIPFPPVIGSWQNIIYVSTGNGGTCYVYFNGTLVGQSNNGTIGNCTSSNLYFGVDIFGPNYINCQLDEIGIWDRALTECEIQDLYHAQLNSASMNISAGLDQSICAGDNVTLNGAGGSNYQWNNNVVDGQAFAPAQSNDYVLTAQDTLGCTGADTVVVTVLENATNTLTETALDSYTLNGQTYTQSGIYTQTLTAANGCDSTITLNLTLNFTGMDELGAGVKKLVKITDLNGKIIPRRKNTLMLFIYEDGTVERVVEMEE